jgi:hypothetical protein
LADFLVTGSWKKIAIRKNSSDELRTMICTDAKLQL